MKNIITLFALLTLTTGLAQKKTKIKGDKKVVENTYILDGFNKININLETKILFSVNNESNSYTIKSDENLQDLFDFKIRDSTLFISSEYKVTSSKKLEIKLSVIDFTDLVLIGKSELIQEGVAQLNENIKIQVSDDTKLSLDIKTKRLQITVNGDAEVELMLKAEKVVSILNDKGELKAKLNVDDAHFELSKNAKTKLEGKATNLVLKATDKAAVKAEKLSTDLTNLNLSKKAEASVNVSKKIQVYLRDDAVLYLYNRPEVIVDGIRNKSKIIKKEL